MTRAPLHVLFLCTGNATRSIFAEAILNRDSGGEVKAFSGGLIPAGSVDPQALALLQRLDFPTRGLRAKSWNEFARADAPRMDAVISVWVDNAGKTCPVVPGQPVTAHWNIPSPFRDKSSDDDRRRAYALTFARLETRIGMLLSLPITRMDSVFLKHRLDEIGEMTEEP